MLLFEVRSFLDSLDGLVARARSRQPAMIADHTQWGYWMDGLCDLIGTIFFMIAVLYLCQRSLPSRRTISFNRPRWWFPMTSISTTSGSADPDQEAFLPSNNNTGRAVTFRQSTILVASLSLLQLISSYFWNRYMEQYHMLLKVPRLSTKIVESFQLETMRSASFW